MSLEPRVARMEHRIRVQTVGLTILSALLAGAMTLALAPRSDELSARQLVLRDSDGTPRTVINTKGFVLLDTAGNERVRISTANGGERFGIFLRDPEGHLAASFSSSGPDAQLVLGLRGASSEGGHAQGVTILSDYTRKNRAVHGIRVDGDGESSIALWNIAGLSPPCVMQYDLAGEAILDLDSVLHFPPRPGTVEERIEAFRKHSIK